MEKTAVEWFVNRLTERGLDYSIEDFEQAKEMEEAQRKNDFRSGWYGNKHKDWNCEFYLIKHINNNFKSK